MYNILPKEYTIC